MGIRRFFSALILVFIFVAHALAQGSTNRAYWTYIDQYKDLAVEQMQKYRIPASITLAQGLLESGAGRSMLATRANNHFGIKTPGGWTGPYVRMNDDRPNEKFRKYRSVRESYEDHSLFLLKPRYKVLFTYSITDYKSWARGLKSCGYATSPTYAQNLIRIIETYSLHQFDSGRSGGGRSKKSKRHGRYAMGAVAPNYKGRTVGFFDTHTIYRTNRLDFIIVEQGDDLNSISRGTGISRRRLRRYNELPKDYQLQAGDIIYLQKKRTRGDKEFKGRAHVIDANQSLYDISQMYGIRIASLYKLNNLPEDYSAKQGDLIWLR